MLLVPKSTRAIDGFTSGVLSIAAGAEMKRWSLIVCSRQYVVVER